MTSDNSIRVFNRLIAKDSLFLELPSNIDYRARKIDTIANRTYQFIREELGNLWTNNEIDKYETVLIRVYKEI